MSIMEIKVKPHAQASKLECTDGKWIAHVKSTPEKGRANAEVITLLALWFKLPKAKITIKCGARSRVKLVNIEQTDRCSAQ